MLENSTFKQARTPSNVCLRTPHLNKQEDLPMYAWELHIYLTSMLQTPDLNKQEDLPMYARELLHLNRQEDLPLYAWELHI